MKKLLSSFSFSREVPFGNEIYWFKFLVSCSFQICMVTQVYSQYPRRNLWRNYFLPAASEGRHPLEMQFIDSSSLGHAVSKYIWLCRSIPKTQEQFMKKLLSSCSFSRETPFGNEIYWFKFLGSCSFLMYMVMQVYSPNPEAICEETSFFLLLQ